jgi:hypothetical protein
MSTLNSSVERALAVAASHTVKVAKFVETVLYRGEECAGPSPHHRGCDVSCEPSWPTLSASASRSSASS